MLRAANQIAVFCEDIEGAADVKVEETTGLPFLEIKIDKAEIARRGLSLADVQDVIGIAIGGREAGLVFEGDRRFEIVVRLPDALRGDVEALRESAGRRCRKAGPGDGAVTIPLAPARRLRFRRRT